MANNWLALPDFWRGRSRGMRMSGSEIAVIRALLPTGDPRSARLLRQAEHARVVERLRLSRQGYQLHIPRVEDARDLIEAESDFTSPPLTTADLISGRKLIFTIKVLRGGFLNDLVGVTEDCGEWPKNWDVGNPNSGVSKNWLPPEMSPAARMEIITHLANWAGRDLVGLSSLGKEYLRTHAPATVDEIFSAESRLGLPLPPEYRQFLEICNGFSVCRGRPYEVFGTGDVYILRMGNVDDCLIAVTNLYEEGMVAMRCGGKEAGTAIYIGPDGAVREAIGDFRRHVHDTLAWAELHGEV